MKKIFLALVMLLSLGSTLWIEKVSAKTVSFTIHNEDDWMKFRQEVEKAKGQYWVDARLEADITTGGGIGLNLDTPYRGTFDGNGHTMTVDIYRDDGKACALFCYVGDVTIKDLHLKGKIKGGIHSAGLIGCAGGGTPTITVDRVWISTEVNANGTHAGGIIGHSGYGNVYMNDCRFDGKVNTNNQYWSHAGEIVGWCDGGRWLLRRIYDQGSPKAENMYFCWDSTRSWGTNGNSFTVTQHNWNTVDHYNKTDQTEVLNLMNGDLGGSWHLVDGNAVPVMNKTPVDTDWKNISAGSSSGYRFFSGNYYITQNIEFSNGNCKSGLTIADGATVHFYIPRGVTLTARGGNASGRSGAGAGIELPQGSSLFLEGKGKVVAQGGNAANGCNGNRGGNAGRDESRGIWPGYGGSGGDGGGGAGAGVGTRGADGGYGGSGGLTSTADWQNHDGVQGCKGNEGYTAATMGNLYVDLTSGVQLDAHGGSQGDRGGYGGSGGSNYVREGGNNYSMAGGGGGAGGGFGGFAQDIGTGGCGGGGGGGGSAGSTRWSRYGYFRTGAYGGNPGANGNGTFTVPSGYGGNTETTGYRYADNNSSGLSDRGYEDGRDNRAGGGGSGDRGNSTRSYPLDKEFSIQFNAVNQFNGAATKTAKAGYKSTTSSGNVTVTIPSFNALGITERDKYVSEWKTERNGSGESKMVGDEYTINKGTKNVYGKWNDYKAIFPKGNGTQGDPFIIEEGDLIDLADYVNKGANTRNVYFRQNGDIHVTNILGQNKRGSEWTAIGYKYPFEGDYDGGGNRIHNAQIANVGTAVGIFGKVSGSIHNLGAEKIKIDNSNENARCGVIAGKLMYDSEEQMTGWMRNCYSTDNNVKAPYVGCVVGEMEKNTSMSRCIESDNVLGGSVAGSFSAIIQENATVDMCYTNREGIAGDNHGKITNCETSAQSEMRSGELTWLLNDKTAFGVTWYQNVDTLGEHNAHPVLDSLSFRVYYDGSRYSNKPSGTLFALSGKGVWDDPFLIKSKADFETVAKYCNGGNKSNGIYLRQTVDIDMNGGGMPINNFGGHYDGGGHTIRNAKIEADGIAGIFGVVSGTVTRLCVENSTFRYMKRDGRVGGIAARITGKGVISNCFVKNCKIMHNGSTGNSNEEKSSRIGVAGGIASDIFDEAVIRNCLVVNTSISATRVGYITSDTKSGTRIERCFTDGNALTSWDHQGSTDIYSLVGVDAASLGRGEITYALNNNSDKNPEPVWYQNISQGSNRDATPVLSSDHARVFKKNGNYTNDGYDIGKLGKGTQENPYKIGTPADLQTLIYSIGVMKRSNFYIRQTADIDLKDSLMVPIGTTIDSFKGHYDGGGHVIKNIEMLNYQGESMGLFNNITGVVENLGIENSKFKAEAPIKRVGAFAGKLTGKGVLRNCYAKGCTIDYRNMPGVVVGALVGEQRDTSRIEACYGYQNTVVGQDNGVKHYGHIVGYIGSNATGDRVFTDGPNLCADNQDGDKKISRSEDNVADLRFKTGEICYLLNGQKTNNSVAWHQAIKTDTVPLLSGKQQVYCHPLNDSPSSPVMYTNTDEVPGTVWVSLNPNHDKLPSRTIDMFKADDRYYVPTFNLTSYAEERLDYDFAGWNTQKDGKGTFYPYNSEIVPTENLPLYAVWDIKVGYEGNGNTIILNSLRKDTIYYKVYDYGGHNNVYGYNYNGKVTLQAPAGYFIQLSGTVATESADGNNKPRDYMTVYEADGEGGFMKLTNESGDSVFYSTMDGVKKDIGTIMGSKEEMIIEFVSDDENCYDGLDLLVTVLPKKIRNLGLGTEDEPFQVASVEDLRTVDECISLMKHSKFYIVQTDNIDMEDEAYEPLTTPLASSVESFEGHYDGGGFEILNMKMVDEKGNATGLFRNVSGVVERLGMVDCNVDGAADKSCIDIIAGRLTGNGQVRNCYAIGNTVSFVGNDKVFTMGTEYTKERFASGEICYLLNGSKSDNTVLWRQTLETDSLPVFANDHEVVYRNMVNDKGIFSNIAATPKYYISSREDFEAFIEKDADIYLTQDINLGNTGFYLRGNFDGGGHSINYGGENEQLFKRIEEGGTVRHLQVLANIQSLSDCGGIAYENQGTISDCHFHGYIRGNKGFLRSAPDIAGIAVKVSDNGTIDHCTFTGYLIKGDYDVQTYTITKDTDRATYCTWVNPNDQTLYAAQRDSALNAQAEYPVYAKGILDAVGPEIILGNQIINVPGKSLSSLTIKDGERFKCSAEVKVNQITYKRRGTNGAYEPWVLPFDYTIDASMLSEGMEFYWFEKDSVGNIVTKQIESGETYQAAANEPLAFRSTNADEISFKMKLVKDGKNQPMTIQMPLDGVAASMSSTKDIANVIATYDSISADRTVKELMYLWNNDKDDFVLGDGETGLQPFRYYLQYIEKSNGKVEKFEDTDWGRSQAEAADSTSQANAKRLVARRAPLSTLTAEGWQAIVLNPHSSQKVTAEMLEDYDILGLWDLYDQKAANNQYAVSIIYVPVPADFELPLLAPLLVRAKHADAKPLVTEQTARDVDAMLAEAIAQVGEEEVGSLFEEFHYWCSTFNGRYDIWPFSMPEKDSELNEYGALAFANKGDGNYFSRVPASDSYTMQPMSYCFTAYDAKTFENLPLANDRIEIVVMELPKEVLGVEDVRGKMDDVRSKINAVYNLNGQKVSDSYRGIVIKNGRKIRR